MAISETTLSKHDVPAVLTQNFKQHSAPARVQKPVEALEEVLRNDLSGLKTTMEINYNNAYKDTYALMQAVHITLAKNGRGADFESKITPDQRLELAQYAHDIITAEPSEPQHDNIEPIR